MDAGDHLPAQQCPQLADQCAEGRLISSGKAARPQHVGQLGSGDRASALADQVSESQTSLASRELLGHDQTAVRKQAGLTRQIDPQHPAKVSPKPGGSGLGLPTTQKIIGGHGGRIGVESELGRGTQFTVELPIPARIASGD